VIHVLNEQPAWSDVAATKDGTVVLRMGVLGEDWYVYKELSPTAARGLAMTILDCATEAEQKKKKELLMGKVDESDGGPR
jgi:hypothetical protein